MKNAKEFIKEWRKVNMPNVQDHEYLQCMYTDNQLESLLNDFTDQFKPKPKKEVKRYFLASYKGFYHNNQPCEGSVQFDCNTYPPRWWIEDKIKKLDPGIWKVIVPIINEVSKEDYESFVSKEN